MSDNYRKALDFLEENLTLIEDHQGEALYSQVPSNKIWTKVVEICYDPEINIDMLEGLTEIPYKYFGNCRSLGPIINIPDLVTKIDDSTFAFCTSLKEVTGMKSVEYIGDDAFYGCTSLETINIPDSVKEIGDTAFYGCTSLETINIPDSVTEIGGSTFYGCTSLEKVTGMKSVKVINDYAFDNCPNLTLQIAKNNQYAINYAERYKIKYILV